MITDYLNSETILLFLAALGYWVASGTIRASYKLLHVALGIASFFAFGLITYHIVEQYFNIHAGWKILVAAIVVLSSAYLWKRYLAENVFRILQKLDITITAFGPSRAWDNFVSLPGRSFCYCHVYLINGDRISSDQDDLTAKKQKNELDFEPYVSMDEEGNVVLIATEFRCGKTGDIKEKIIADEGRTKFTYIPASNIARIEAFIEPK